MVLSARLMVVLFALSGAVACGGGSSEPAPASAAATEAAGETGHAHAAPHGGTLIELGDHFAFLEFVLDAATGTVTLYVLDGGAEQAVRIAQPSVSLAFDAPSGVAGQTLELAALANVLTGEAVGDTSQFAVTHEGLKDQTAFTARVVEVSVKGQPFRDLVVAHQ